MKRTKVVSIDETNNYRRKEVLGNYDWRRYKCSSHSHCTSLTLSDEKKRVFGIPLFLCSRIITIDTCAIRMDLLPCGNTLVAFCQIYVKTTMPEARWISYVM